MSDLTSFYYIQRDTEAPSRTGTSSHIPAVPIQSVPISVPNMDMQSSMNFSEFESHPYVINSESHPTLVQAQHVPASAGSGLMATGTEPLKKKRGRPRKHVPKGPAGLPLVPLSAFSPSGMRPGTSSGSGKRRGRPPGTGTKQQLAQLGDWLSSSAGVGFTPHAVRIAVGEDISSKIMSFSQHGPRAVCILSANGAVSIVTLHQNSSSGGTVTYEGCFEIISLSGSYMITDTESGTRCRTGGLNISLSSSDGCVFGGSVGGILIAASPIQVIVGSFMHLGTKAKVKAKESPKPGQPGFEFGNHTLNDLNTPQSGVLSDKHTSPMIWAPSMHTANRSGNLGIDLTSG